MLKFHCYFATDVGKVRKNNEDNFYCNGFYKKATDVTHCKKACKVSRAGVFAVCDGMGGEEHGEKASLYAVETLKEFKKQNISDTIDTYVKTANEKICNMITENNGTRSGTTLALLHMKDECAHCYNIGDSRIYLIREGNITQITEDHTRATQMVKMGVLTREQALTHRDRHVLTQHMGIFPEEMEIGAYHPEPIAVQEDDIFLLCSDGLTDMLSDAEISAILQPKMKPSKFAEALISEALRKGGKDNVTVGIVKVSGKKRLPKQKSV